jgi:hypothetical protein
MLAALRGAVTGRCQIASQFKSIFTRLSVEHAKLCWVEHAFRPLKLNLGLL